MKRREKAKKKGKIAFGLLVHLSRISSPEEEIIA